jgi:hypothetical protein
LDTFLAYPCFPCFFVLTWLCLVTMQALGLAKDASVTDIKKAFRTLSLTHHPDKGGETELFQIVSSLPFLSSFLSLCHNPPLSFLHQGSRCCFRSDESQDITLILCFFLLSTDRLMRLIRSLLTPTRDITTI